MNQHHTAPGDGPLMLWIAAHAKQYVINLADQQGFEDVLAGYRYARGARRPYDRDAIPTMIERLASTIDFEKYDNRYIARITIGHTRLLEKHEEIDGRIKGHLTIATEEPIADSMVASLVGEDVGKFILLPANLQSVIAGRKIIETEIRGSTKLIHLNANPWK